MTRTFQKSERLTGRKAIGKVFSEGELLFKHPLQLRYLVNPEQSTNRFLVAVPKRLFKRAVDRNLLKRRMREAYRLNKYRIHASNLDIACTFVGKEIVDYSEIEKKLCYLFERLK